MTHLVATKIDMKTLRIICRKVTLLATHVTNQPYLTRPLMTLTVVVASSFDLLISSLQVWTT